MSRKLGRASPPLTFGALTVAERRWSLRPYHDPGPRRLLRNGVIAATAGLALLLVEEPLVRGVRRWGARHGLLPRLRLPATIESVAAALLLDYNLYLWHVLTHRVPFLWRFHRVHHADRDLDASTAMRFHFGEMALSAPIRAAQVALYGISPQALRLWRTLLGISILFHHANLRLPARLERWLSRLVMTPRLHGIHHDQRERVRDCNWSSGLAIWDFLHRSFRDDLPQAKVRIGVPEREGGILRLLSWPFHRRSR